MSLQFDQRRVLVTGASTGIGAAVALAFARAGAHVAVHHNRSRGSAEQVADEAKGAGGEISLVQGDVLGPAPLRTARRRRPSADSPARWPRSSRARRSGSTPSRRG